MIQQNLVTVTRQLHFMLSIHLASILMKKLTIMWEDNSGMVEQKIFQNKLEAHH